MKEYCIATNRNKSDCGLLGLLQIRFQQTPKAFEAAPRTSQAVRLGWLGHPSNSHCHPQPHRQTTKTGLR